MSRIPACWVRLCGRLCRFPMLMPGTTTPSPRFVRSTRSTVPRLPRSLPASTTTVSPFLIFISQDLRGERHDLHVVALSQPARDRPEDSSPARAALRRDQHGRVLVEADVAAIGAAVLLGGAHDDGPPHGALLDPRIGPGPLDARNDHVAGLRSSGG